MSVSSASTYSFSVCKRPPCETKRGPKSVFCEKKLAGLPSCPAVTIDVPHGSSEVGSEFLNAYGGDDDGSSPELRHHGAGAGNKNGRGQKMIFKTFGWYPHEDHS